MGSQETSRFDFTSYTAAWPGLPSLTSIVAFGDSCTQYDDNTTWLSHFRDRLSAERNIAVYNFAVPGSAIEDDLEDQIYEFLDEKIVFDPQTTLFVFWYGTNDCGQTYWAEFERIVEKLFHKGIEELYLAAEAQNFLIIDIPPMDRSPIAMSLESAGDFSDRYIIWNQLLKSRTERFSRSMDGTSVFLFSSYTIIGDILSHPNAYGFKDEDVVMEEGPIWLDDLHFTTKIHAIIADKLDSAFRNL